MTPGTSAIELAATGGGHLDHGDAELSAVPGGLGLEQLRFVVGDSRRLVRNARLVHERRQGLVDGGLLRVKDLAEIWGVKPNTAHKRVRRAADRGELFTVDVNGETGVPAVLLDDGCEPDPVWLPVLAVLTSAGYSGWDMWAWIAEPNASLSDAVAAELVRTAPARVFDAANRDAAAAGLAS